jgi:hypothetical protein
VTEYQVVVVTASGLSSATDSSVYLKLVGDGGDSGEFELDRSEHMNKFESGQTDTFTFHSNVALGSVQQVHVRLETDGNLIKRSWRLQSIEVKGGDLQAPAIFHHEGVLSPDNPSVVLMAVTASGLSSARDNSVYSSGAEPVSSVSQALKPSLSRKASAKLKGAMVTMDVSFGPQVQRVLQSINQTPVCFAMNTQSNTLIVGERVESLRVAKLFFVLITFYESGYDNGCIIDCSVPLLEGKIQQVTGTKTASATSHGGHDAVNTSPVIHRRALDAHRDHSVVAVCLPKLPLNPDALISCARQSVIVVWSSPSEYTTYAGHPNGARYSAVAHTDILHILSLILMLVANQLSGGHFCRCYQRRLGGFSAFL